MKQVFKKISKVMGRFFSNKFRYRLLLLVFLIFAAFADFITLGLARRTFVFYTVSNGAIVVEDRMLRQFPDREVNITRYVQEALLGPFAPDLRPLFPRETRLQSLLYRNGVVYANFSMEAALPPEEGGEVLENFRTLYAGIRRNFPFVRDVKFFIAGRAAFVDEFRRGNGAS